MLCVAAHNTYIPTWEGWLYLASVIDCCTKECIGYALADHMRADLVIDALQMAARNHTLADGAIFHSDRGTQGGFNWSSQHQFNGENIAHSGAFRRGCSSRVLCGVAC